MRFVTRLYHPNVDASGEVCLDVLDEAWCPALTVSAVLICVVALLADPCPADQLAPLHLDVAEVFRNDPLRFESTARDWTRLYAQSGGGA